MSRIGKCIETVNWWFPWGEGKGKGKERVLTHSFGVMEMVRNWMVVIVVQLHEYTNTH